MTTRTLARWSFRILGVAAAAVLLIAGGVAFLLFTTPGARLAFDQARKLGLPASVREVGGSLRGPLVLNGLRIETGSLRMEADSLLLDVRLRDLIVDGRLTVRRLLGEGVALTVAADDASGGDADPDDQAGLDIPVELTVDTARLEEVTLSLPNDIRVEKGELGLSGTPEEYSLSATGRLRVSEGHEAAFEIAANGSLERLRIQNARARLDGSTLSLAGELGWRPTVSWDLRARAAGVDPSVLLNSLGSADEWAGELTLDTHVVGHLTQAGPVGRLVVDTLRGTLRDRRVAGGGSVAVDSSRISVPRLALTWGGASLRASGAVEDDLQLDFRVHVPDMALIVPGASGEFRASGILAGTRAAPRIDSELSARGVAYAAQRARSISGDVVIDFSGSDTLDLRLEAAQLDVMGRSVDSLTLSIEGSRGRHSLTLTASRDRVAAELEAKGGLAGSAWSGALERLRLANPALGEWRLSERPPYVSLAPDSVVLGDTLCLTSRDSRLCAAGAWTRGAGSRGSLTIDDLPLALAEPLLPDGWSLSGPLTGRILLSAPVDGPLHVEATLAPGPGEIVYLLRGIPRTLAYDEGLVELRGDAGSLNGRLRLGLREPQGDSVGRVTARFRVPDLTAGLSAVRDEPVQARVKARLHNLYPLDQLVERVDNLRGDLAIDLFLRGTVESPTVLGEARWLGGKASVPALGVELDEIAMTATGEEGGRVVIEGEARSGEGRVKISGDSPSRPSEEVPSRLTLEGDRFLAMGTERARVLVSPKIKLEFDGRRVLVEGDVDVPEARVRLREVSESAVPVSDDVVFVDSMAVEGDEPMVLEARLAIGLGEDVTVSGFGFHASLGGDLQVVEQPAEPMTASGTITIQEGVYTAFGQKLQIEGGRLMFAGGPIDNPGLNVRATRTTSDSVTVGVLVSGTLRAPLVTLYSEPPLPQREIIAGLVTGGTLEGAGASTEDPLAAARTKLSLKGASLLVKQIAAELELDEARIESRGYLREASLMAGKYLSPRLYVAYGVSVFDPLRSLQVRYLLSSNWTLVAETGDETAADLLYRIETGE